MRRCEGYPTNGNLAQWDVSGVTDLGCMFEGAAAFNGDLAWRYPSRRHKPAVSGVMCEVVFEKVHILKF